MITVVVGIILQNTNVLLCQRNARSRYGLKWEFPGGKLEKGETAESCLRRELNEELGIDAEIGDLFLRQQAYYPDSGAFDVYYYRVATFNGTIVNNVFENVQWVPVAELSRFDILDGNRDVVQKLLATHAPAEPLPR